MSVELAVISLALSAFGTGASIMGQQQAAAITKKAAAKQKEAVRFNNNLSFKEFKKKVKLAQDAADLAKATYEQESEAQYQANLEEYHSALAIRKRQYNDAVKLYKESVDNFDTELAYNNLNSQLAMNDLARVQQDRFNQIGFNSQEMMLELDASRRKNRLEKQGISQQQETSIADTEIKFADVQRQMDDAASDANLSRKEAYLNISDTKAEASAELEKLRQEQVQATGGQRALGQAGRSAAKSVQGLMMQNQAAQTMLVNAVTRADSQFNFNKEQIAQNLLSSRKQGLNAIDGLANNLLADQRNFINQKRALDIQQLDLARATKLSLNSLRTSAESSIGQYKDDTQRVQLQKNIADRVAASKVLSKPRRPDIIEPPTKPPPFIEAPQEEINWGDIRKQLKLSKKAGMPFNPSNLALQQLGAIADFGVQAVKTLEKFKAPKVADPTELFDFNAFNPNIPNQSNPFNLDIQPTFNVDNLPDFNDASFTPSFNFTTNIDTST
tara:strand:+ start:4038 stop:5537 length:1500 start_codon:yes stop_codon:yes gene_type:complete